MRDSRLRRWLLALVALPGVAALSIAIVGPYLPVARPAESAGVPFAPPTSEHPLGLWRNGWDVWAGIAHGGRPILVLPLLAAVASLLIGLSAGLIAAWSRAGVALVWCAGALMATPPILVLLVLVTGWGASGLVLAAAVVLTSAPFTARITSAAARAVLGRPFVEHAVAAGDRATTVLRREVLPNVAGPVLADAGLRFVGAIYLVAAASYLGFSPGGQIDWARMIAESAQGAALNGWALIAPAACLAALVVATNLALDRIARRVAR